MTTNITTYQNDISAYFKEHSVADSETYVAALYAKGTVEERGLIEDALEAIGSDLTKDPSTAIEDSGFTKENISHCKSALSELRTINADHMQMDLFSILALIQKSGQNMRDAMRQVRGAESSAQITNMLDSAKEMKTAANHRFKAAQIQAYTQIATGSLQVIGTGVSAFSSFKSMGKMDTITKTDALGKNYSEMVATASSEKWSNGASATKGATDGLSAIGEGVGKIFSSREEREASLADARSREFDAASKLNESAVQESNEQMQRALEIIQDAASKLQSIQQSNLETNRTINNNI